MKPTKIYDLYNGSTTIVEAGYTMISNHLLELLNRMRIEKILNTSATIVIQHLLTKKRGKVNPFPSRATIAKQLGTGLDFVKEAFKSMKNSRVVNFISRKGQTNEVDMQPLFDILEKYIKEAYINGNYDIKVADLMNVEVVNAAEKSEGTKEEKKKDNDFSKYKGNKKEIVHKEVIEESEEAPASKEEVPAIKEPSTLPGEILHAIETYNIDEKGIIAIEQAYKIYSSKLDDIIFIEKIAFSSNKKDFVKYFNTCIANAAKNGEKPVNKNGKICESTEAANKMKESRNHVESPETTSEEFIKARVAIQKRLQSKYNLNKDEK